MAYPRGTILIYSGISIFDSLIRIFSGSKWTHCAVALGDGQAIQAQWGGPVRVMNEIQGEPTIKFHYPGRTEFMIAQLFQKLYPPTPYDYLGTLNVVLYKLLGKCFDPECRGKARFCSTFMVEAMDKDPDMKFRVAPGKPLHAITPQDIYNAFEPHGLEIP